MEWTLPLQILRRGGNQKVAPSWGLGTGDWGLGTGDWGLGCE